MGDDRPVASLLLEGEAPDQFRVGDRCDDCRKPLSRYNAYTTCGPCRMRLSTGEHPVTTFSIRQVVRRGPIGV